MGMLLSLPLLLFSASCLIVIAFAPPTPERGARPCDDRSSGTSEPSSRPKGR